MLSSAISKQALIELQDVSYSYPVSEQENIPALKSCSFKLYDGEFVAVIGGNGSGKSTLAKHLNGLLVPNAGKVLVGGMDTANQADIWEIRRLVGMVFQNPDNQLVAAVCEEDVAFGPENLGLPPEQIKARVEYALKLMNLTELKDRPPHMLSGGQKQRLAIAGVLAMRPKCLVLDEPTAMLDPAGRKEVLEVITELNRKHKITVVLITHLMEEAVLADRIIALKEGQIVMDSFPREVFSSADKLRQLGLELPDIILLAEKLKALGVPQLKTPLNLEELVDDLCGQLS